MQLQDIKPAPAAISRPVASMLTFTYNCEPQVPEPDAEGLVQLQDMGFPAGLAAKALLLSHNVPAAALEWALQHADDADADAPPSQDALRAGQ